MNIATGTLVLVGFLTIVLGMTSKLMGIPLLAPFIMRPSSYFVVAVTCLVIALIIDRFEKS